MTIFNWVQKKLHQNVIKEIDAVTKSEKKKKQNEGKSEIEKNTKAILDQVGLVDAFDNWFDGVLTIGTFGFDTLNFKEEDDDEECGSMDLDYVVIDGSIIKNVYDQEIDPLISNEIKFSDDHQDVGVLDDTNHDYHFGSIKTSEMPVIAVAVAEIEPQKKRPTLAELFMEDRDEGDDTWNGKKSKNPNLGGDEEVKYYKQKGSKLSKKFSLVKKKLVMSKSKDEEKESRPIKKMHQMIKRMLKKKIYPDIEATNKAFKQDVPYKPIRKCEALESRYLFKIQDCIA